MEWLAVRCRCFCDRSVPSIPSGRHYKLYLKQELVDKYGFAIRVGVGHASDNVQYIQKISCIHGDLYNVNLTLMR